MKWMEEADVVVVGYGGAGAVTAIAAHDAGAKVLLLEKQPSDTPSQTRHTPSTRMSGGFWHCPTDLDKSILYQEGLAKIANETLDAERKELLSVFAQYLVSNTDWMKNIGVETGGDESISPNFIRDLGPDARIVEGRLFGSDFPESPWFRLLRCPLAQDYGQLPQWSSTFQGSVGSCPEERYSDDVGNPSHASGKSRGRSSWGGGNKQRQRGRDKGKASGGAYLWWI